MVFRHVYLFKIFHVSKFMSPSYPNKHHAQFHFHTFSKKKNIKSHNNKNNRIIISSCVVDKMFVLFFQRLFNKQFSFVLFFFIFLPNKKEHFRLKSLNFLIISVFLSIKIKISGVLTYKKHA